MTGGPIRPHPLVPEALYRSLADTPAEGGPSGAAWLRSLGRLVESLLSEWGLHPVSPSLSGRTAVVIPVDRDGERLVLKVGWPHEEARGEHLALRHWAGDGAVRLVAADPLRQALLLEALDPTRDLRTVSVDAACEVTGALLARLHRPAPPNLRRLSDVVEHHVSVMEASPDLLPRRIVSRARGLFEELRADPASDALLLHTDLHFENVLASSREPWLAIDPKPMAGHPGFELQPLLRNRTDDYGTGPAFRWGVRRRVEITCEAAGMDFDAARRWTIIRSAIEAMWAARHRAAHMAGLHIALIKALDD